MRHLLVICIHIGVVNCQWVPPVDNFGQSASITAVSLSRDWVWQDTPTSIVVTGSFSTPAGCELVSTTVELVNSNDAVVQTLTDSVLTSTSLTLSVPVLSDIGRHCISSITARFATFDQLHVFDLLALGEVQCFVSSPHFSALADVSVQNGPPSGGTSVIFSVDVFYSSGTGASFDFDCVFGTVHVPLVYTVPSVSGTVTGAVCDTPSAPLDRFVCVQLVPRDAWFLLVETFVQPCAIDGSEFAFSYYAQMPLLVSVSPVSGSYLGGSNLVISGFNFPDNDSSRGLIVVRIGTYLDTSCAMLDATSIGCDDIVSAAQAGVDLDPTVSIFVSFNNEKNFAVKFVQFTYVPIAVIDASTPTWGPYSGPSVVQLEISYISDDEDVFESVTSPVSVCYYLATDLSVPFSHITLQDNDTVELPDVVSSDPTVTVYLSIQQEDGRCDANHLFSFTRRPTWTATSFGQAIVYGGSMSVEVVGGNLHQAAAESVCRVTAVWPESSHLSGDDACVINGTMGSVIATSGLCEFDLGTQFYQCGYLAARAGTEVYPNELFLWDNVNLQIDIAMNGVNFAPLSDNTIRAIRLPVIKRINPSFGFDFGGYMIELELAAGVAWHVVWCKFYNPSTSMSRLVNASPFAVRTVGCLAPKWKLNSAFETFQVSLLIEGSHFSASVDFQVQKSPRIFESSPREGPISGYTRVAVSGSDFNFAYEGIDDLVNIQCVFGAVSVVPAYYVSSSVIECLTPPSDASGYVTLDIALNWASNSDANRLSTVYIHQEIFHYLPSVVHVVSISPLSGPRSGHTGVRIVTITPLLNNGLVRCVFGEIFVAADWQSETELLCLSPSSWAIGTVDFTLSLDSQTTVQFYFENDIGPSVQGSVGVSNFLYYYPASVSGTVPRFGSVTGATTVLFRGTHFRDTPETSCRFGVHVGPIVRFISSHAVICIAPSGWLGDVDLAISNNGVDFVSGSGSVYTFVEATPLLSMSPFMGPISGGTIVVVTPVQLDIPVESLAPGSTPLCSFGSYIVSGLIIDSELGVMQCPSPEVVQAGLYLVGIYYNGQDANYVAQQYLYYGLTTMDSIDPPIGPQGFPKTITITGSNFVNSNYLTVRFGTPRLGYVDVPGVWISDSIVRVVAPKSSPAFGYLRLPIMISNNGIDYSPSEVVDWDPNNDRFDTIGVVKYFTLHVPVVLKLVNPSFANMHGGGYVSVFGGPFMNTGSLACGFDWIYTDPAIAKPIFISATEILCPVPDMWAGGAASSLSRIARLQVALVSPDWSDTFIEFTFLPISPPGFITPHYDSTTYTSNFVPCGVGYRCPQAGLSGQIQCPPGTYQPRPGALQCVSCPIGYYCPHTRMDAPTLCPPGWVCDEDGLISPYKRCPAGHICLLGTATRDVLPSPLSGPAPYRCLQGMYCLEGVVTFVSVPGNYSTPQPCFQGSYCKPGSSSPFGTGAVPLGRYSVAPNNPGTLCPPRFACGPTTGRIEPAPCRPGTYNLLSGQHNCTLAYEGTISPNPMLMRPLPTDCGHQGGRKGIFSLGQNDLCPSATTCGYGVASNNEPQVCFAVLTTNATEIAFTCKWTAGQIFWPAGTFAGYGLKRFDPNLAYCCWSYYIVDFFAEKVAEIYEKNPFGEGYEGKSARRFKQRLAVVHAELVQQGYPGGLDGIQMIERVSIDSLRTIYGVHCQRVRQRIMYAIERYTLFKPPQFCEAGKYCNPGTCAAFPTVETVSGFYDSGAGA